MKRRLSGTDTWTTTGTFRGGGAPGQNSRRQNVTDMFCCRDHMFLLEAHRHRPSALIVQKLLNLVFPSWHLCVFHTVTPLFVCFWRMCGLGKKLHRHTHTLKAQASADTYRASSALLHPAQACTHTCTHAHAHKHTHTHTVLLCPIMCWIWDRYWYYAAILLFLHSYSLRGL